MTSYYRQFSIAATCAATAVLVLAGCAGAGAPSQHHVAVAYLKAHPVAQRAGMAAGIVIGESADASEAVYTWTQTLVTADNHTVTITCGNVQAADPCTWRSDGPGPGQPQCGPLGDYEYFPADLNASNSSSIIVIRCGAVH